VYKGSWKSVACVLGSSLFDDANSDQYLAVLLSSDFLFIVCFRPSHSHLSCQYVESHKRLQLVLQITQSSLSLTHVKVME